jgi:hypothetical protein
MKTARWSPTRAASGAMRTCPRGAQDATIIKIRQNRIKTVKLDTNSGKISANHKTLGAKPKIGQALCL